MVCPGHTYTYGDHHGDLQVPDLRKLQDFGLNARVGGALGWEDLGVSVTRTAFVL